MKTTLTLAAVLDLICAADPTVRWTLTGWMGHMKNARAALHAARSYAKHRGEFGNAGDYARMLTIARCVEFGETFESAGRIVEEAIEARCAKEGA